MENKVLESIAFIPDGNRRFSRKNSIELFSAYSQGLSKALAVLEWLDAYPEITTGTFYTLSVENLNRTNEELTVLFSLFEKELLRLLDKDFFTERNTRLKFIGRLNLLPDSIQKLISYAEEKTTSPQTKRTINLAIAYNGQYEIVDACKKIAEKYKSNGLQLDQIDVNFFMQYLYSQFKAPDLIIRTSGEERLSGFLTFQSAYSELYFVDKLWPELTKADLDLAVQDYYSRKRNFGK